MGAFTPVGCASRKWVLIDLCSQFNKTPTCDRQTDIQA